MTAQARWNMPSIAAAIELAEELLAKGLTVAVATVNAAPFAMLVNRFGDRFLSIELDRHGRPRGHAGEPVPDDAPDVDALLVVGARGGRHGALGAA
ncbi:hypothetical protein MUN78_16075 [Leucobacter allii]|uniref:Uncharacterized protein n=1 Tax=Leucobacter allii TaxID=2932247 RepID=A0ABY4FLK8_9MICO|nr:hypothetical protein [Leucobacter allii]UOQ57149.1 hypothetical protein MUN78_16075 [Leucobacter allii]UOR01655.1 hypothetical protein MUN77_16315 [Leucobacter allii]